MRRLRRRAVRDRVTWAGLGLYASSFVALAFGLGGLAVVMVALAALPLAVLMAGDAWAWLRRRRERGDWGRALAGVVGGPWVPIVVLYVAGWADGWATAWRLPVLMIVWVVAVGVVRGTWRAARRARASAERAREAALTVERMVGAAVQRQHLARPGDPPVYVPVQVVGDAVDPGLRLVPGQCTVVPEGEVVIDSAGFIVRAEDPRVHEGALPFCVLPEDHRGRHSWEMKHVVETVELGRDDAG
jgi:hypothetical protein